jgi:hypothetical protein
MVCTLSFNQSGTSIDIVYSQSFAQYLIFFQKKVIIDRIFIDQCDDGNQNDCHLKGHIINGELILTDVCKWQGQMLSNLSYTKRHKIMSGVVLSGIPYSIVQLIPARKIADYIQFHLQYEKFAPFVCNVNFYYNNDVDLSETIYTYSVSEYDFLLPKSILTWKFILQHTAGNATKRINENYQLLLKTLSSNDLRHYQYVKKSNIKSQIVSLINTQSKCNSLCVQCYKNKYNEWIPLTVVDEEPDAAKF